MLGYDDRHDDRLPRWIAAPLIVAACLLLWAVIVLVPVMLGRAIL